MPMNVDQFLQEITEPLSNERISMEPLLYNLNALIGYFAATESFRAANTVRHAEQTIKNFLLSCDENYAEQTTKNFLLSCDENSLKESDD